MSDLKGKVGEAITVILTFLGGSGGVLLWTWWKDKKKQQLENNRTEAEGKEREADAEIKLSNLYKKDATESHDIIDRLEIENTALKNQIETLKKQIDMDKQKYQQMVDELQKEFDALLIKFNLLKLRLKIN